MNLAIRGLNCNLGDEDASTFTRDKHKDLKADFILANPPFKIYSSMSVHQGEDTDIAILTEKVKSKIGTLSFVYSKLQGLVPIGTNPVLCSS